MEQARRLLAYTQFPVLLHEILENLANVANRQRIMAGAFDEMEFAVRQTDRDISCQPMGEGPVLCPVPKRHRYAHLVERESPRRRVDLRVGHDAVRRGAPGLARARETNGECARFAK